MARRFWTSGNSESPGFVGLAWCAMAFAAACSMRLVINRAPATMTPSPMPGNANTLLA
ncbi:Uncharacterised protein [Mycobacterium tuberculosis]|nr:Uncharacterised protein [Mycobacterium tuberculosis]